MITGRRTKSGLLHEQTRILSARTELKLIKIRNSCVTPDQMLVFNQWIRRMRICPYKKYMLCFGSDLIRENFVS